MVALPAVAPVVGSASLGCSMVTSHPSVRSRSPITAMSRMFGTLWTTDRPGASSAAAISFSAEFFAPPT